MRTAMIGLLAVVGLSTAEDDGPLAVKVRPPAAGHRYRTVAETTAEVRVRAGGENVREPQDKTIKTESKTEYTAEILAWPADGAATPLKVRRKYHTAEATGPEGQAADLRLAGRTVTVTRKDDGAVDMEADGIDPLPPAADGLVRGDFPDPKRSLDGNTLLPPKPLKPGDTWDLDLKRLFAICPDNLARDEAGATGTGKLLERTTKDGRVFARFELTAEVPVTKQTQPDGTEAPLRAGSKITLTYTFDGCVDGSRADSTTVVVVGTELRPEAPPGVELSITTTNTRKRVNTDQTE